MIKLYTDCLVLFIGNLIVGQSGDNIKIVKYDIYLGVLPFDNRLLPRIQSQQTNWVSNSLKSTFYQSDLDLGLVTLILKLDLDIIKMSICAKNEVPVSTHSTVKAGMGTHTDRMKTLPSRHIKFNESPLLQVVGRQSSDLKKIPIP